MEEKKLIEVRTRIAPSPTGDPHVGTLYIALFNYVFAKRHHGKFILRIEDTDLKRSSRIYEENIFKALHWAGLSWAEGPDCNGPYGPYRQSERLDIYQKYIKILLDKKMAYKCFATAEELQEMRQIASKTGQKSGYDRRYRNLSDEEILKREKNKEPFVIRLKVPLTGECRFHDEIKGDITTPWADIDDQVLIKSDGFPTYHFAVVVDDFLMKISHVIRGDEWISSTPKHILLYDAFGWPKPKFMHMPLLLGADGRKLSKRRNPTSTFYFRDSGYLPQALLNFLSLMGYSMPNEKEVYSVEDLIQEFDETRIGKSGAFFDIRKLDWLNQKYIIETLSPENLLDQLKKWAFNDEFFQKLIPLIHTRMKTFGEFMELCDFFFINHVSLSKEILCPKNVKEEAVCYIFQTILWLLDEHEIWSKEVIETISHQVAEMFGVSHKKVIIPMLFASIMGKTEGPSLYHSFELLGKDRARARILKAMEIFGGISGKAQSLLKKGLDKKDMKDLLT